MDELSMEMAANLLLRESLYKLRVRVGIGMALLHEARRRQYPCRIAKVCDKEAAPFRPNPKGCRLKSPLTALPSLAVQGVLSSRLRLVSRDFRRQRDRAIF